MIDLVEIYVHWYAGHSQAQIADTGFGTAGCYSNGFCMLPQPARSTGHCWQLAFIDLDRFKDINDRHPHDVGDHVLQADAPNTSGCTRDAGRVLRHSQPRPVVARRSIPCPSPMTPGRPSGLWRQQEFIAFTRSVTTWSSIRPEASLGVCLPGTR
jgi:Diguanylate cyclase, GGDEF domain